MMFNSVSKRILQTITDERKFKIKKKQFGLKTINYQETTTKKHHYISLAASVASSRLITERASQQKVGDQKCKALPE